MCVVWMELSLFFIRVSIFRPKLDLGSFSRFRFRLRWAAVFSSCTNMGFLKGSRRFATDLKGWDDMVGMGLHLLLCISERGSWVWDERDRCVCAGGGIMKYLPSCWNYRFHLGCSVILWFPSEKSVSIWLRAPSDFCKASLCFDGDDLIKQPPSEI